MKCFTNLQRLCSGLCSISWLELGVVATWLWNLSVILLCCIGLALVFVGGCGNRVVLVSESSPVRIGPKAKGKVYSFVENEWQLSENEVSIPEGWYLVPPSYLEE